MHKRRVILLTISSVAATSAAGIPLFAFGALQKLDPKDPQAVSLGYVDETTMVDKTKFPKHDNTQMCSGCQFYQTAQEAGAIAPCTIFGGKAVSAKGWCSSWVKRAG
jgi:hypothetical protein